MTWLRDVLPSVTDAEPDEAVPMGWAFIYFSRGGSQTVLHCAQHSHPPNPERAETRSCPRRAHSDRTRSASKKDGLAAPSPCFTCKKIACYSHGRIALC